MADIFISYSKADHALALKLSAFLEAEGWSVWWDKSLAAADLYRDEIMKQLAAARAVITIWTENSVRSDWVRAEAGRAKAEGKLIPVKTDGLTYGDIPLPFGEMHTENISSTDLIRAAIVAQLAKPAVAQSPFWQITSTFKYNVLTWIGIVGSAITLFANLSGVLDLADWARELVEHWHEWTQMFWGWVFSLVKMRVPKPFVPIISFIASAGILVAGVNLSARTVGSAVTLQYSPSVARKIRIIGGGVLLCLLELVIIFPLVFIIFQGILTFVSRALSWPALEAGDVPLCVEHLRSGRCRD
jgi:TIR domain